MATFLSQRLGRLLLLLLLLSSAILFISSVQTRGHVDDCRSPIAIPGGVADPTGRTGYVENAAGATEAIDLATGKVHWTYAGPGRPLLACDRRLAVQAPVADKPNAFRVVLIDSNDGKRIAESVPIALPEWVAIEGAPGKTTFIEPSVQNGTLQLRWEAQARYAGGAPPPPDVVARSKQDARGVVSVDFASAEVKTDTAAPAQQAPKRSETLQELNSHPYERRRAVRTDPVIVGDNVVTFLVDDRGGLAQGRWDLATGKKLATVALAGDLTPSIQVTPDNRYALVHDAAYPEKRLPPGQWPWLIYALETGTLVRQLVYQPGAQSPAVLGDRLYVAVDDDKGGRALRAIDLNSGKELWQRPITAGKKSPPPPLRR